MRGERGSTKPQAPNHYGAPKNTNNVTSAFFNAVDLLPKDLRIERGDVKPVFSSRTPSNPITPLILSANIYVLELFSIYFSPLFCHPASLSASTLSL